MLLGNCVVSFMTIRSNIARPLGWCLFTAAGYGCCHDASIFSSQCSEALFLPRYLQAGLNSQEEPNGDGQGVAVGEDYEKDSSYSLPRNAASPGNDGATADDSKKAEESQAEFTDAVDGLDDIVTGMNAFVDDSNAGLDGAEVEAVGGPVQFDVDKFMSLLNGEDLM